MKAKVLHTINHDGTEYAPGQTFEGSKEVVATLIEAGALRDPNAPEVKEQLSAEAEAEQVLATANAQATKLLSDAQAEAEKVKAAAQEEATKVVSDAQAEAEKVKAAAKPASK